MGLRALVVSVALVLGVLGGGGMAGAQTTTTTVPRATACAWEWGGQAELTPYRCDDQGEVGLPEWLLVAAALGVFAGFAGLLASWRR